MVHTGSTFLGILSGLRAVDFLPRLRSPTYDSIENDGRCDEKQGNPKKYAENFNRRLLGISGYLRRTCRFVGRSLTSRGSRSGTLRARRGRSGNGRVCRRNAGDHAVHICRTLIGPNEETLEDVRFIHHRRNVDRY